MKRFWGVVLGIIAVTSLVPTVATACPNCFQSTDEQVLHTYYFSALFLSAIPFAIIGAIVSWISLRQRRQTRLSGRTQHTHRGEDDGTLISKATTNGDEDDR